MTTRCLSLWGCGRYSMMGLVIKMLSKPYVLGSSSPRGMAWPCTRYATTWPWRCAPLTLSPRLGEAPPLCRCWVSHQDPSHPCTWCCNHHLLPGCPPRSSFLKGRIVSVFPRTQHTVWHMVGMDDTITEWTTKLIIFFKSWLWIRWRWVLLNLFFPLAVCCVGFLVIYSKLQEYFFVCLISSHPFQVKSGSLTCFF